MRSRYWADGWPAFVGLAAGLTGFGLLFPRLKPGTATGWAVLLLLGSLVMLALPWLTVVARMMAWRHEVRGMPRPASLSLTDERLRVERDGMVGEYAWRHVRKTTETAGCHMIWLRASGNVIALPTRSIPSELRIEVAEFLSQHGNPAPGQATRN